MPVVDVLRGQGDAFRRSVLSQLFDSYPHTRLWFPPHAEDAHAELVFALTYLLERDDLDLAATLARDHLKVGITAVEVRGFFGILSRTIHQFCAELPYDEVAAADRQLSRIRDAFLGEVASRVSGAPGAPGAPGAVWPAHYRVAEVQRRARRFSVVRLTGEKFSYAPGQFVSVTSQHTQGRWRNLCPAMPPSDGMIEFHLFDDSSDDVLHSLSRAQIGDTWSLGIPHGNLHVSGENDVLMIAHATGLAPMKAILMELLTRSSQPRVHLFYGAEYPGELYDLRGTWNLAAVAPWLSVTPVTGMEDDPWWVGSTEHCTAPRGLHLQEVASIADAVTKWGTWADREVLVAGPEEMVRNTVASLVAKGTPEANIQHLPCW